MAINRPISGGSTGHVANLGATEGTRASARPSNDYEMRQSESTGPRAATGAGARSNPLTAIKNFFTQTIPNFFKSLFGSGGGGGATAAPTTAPALTRATPDAPVRGPALDLSAYRLGDGGGVRLLNDVLSNVNPELTAAFEKHCAKVFIADDLDFLRDVQAYKENPRPEEARRIHDTYVDARGHKSMNLEGGERGSVTEELRKPGGDASPSLFDNVFNTVFSATVLDHGKKFMDAVGR